MKLLCILLGHKDPVMSGVGVVSQEQLYQNWLTWERVCDRCGKNLKPNHA